MVTLCNGYDFLSAESHDYGEEYYKLLRKNKRKFVKKFEDKILLAKYDRDKKVIEIIEKDKKVSKYKINVNDIFNNKLDFSNYREFGKILENIKEKLEEEKCFNGMNFIERIFNVVGFQYILTRPEFKLIYLEDWSLNKMGEEELNKWLKENIQ